MHIALYQPDIPQNVGSMIRLSACFGGALHIIEPCGFAINEKGIRRVAMDYIDHAQIVRHASWDIFKQWQEQEKRRLVLLTTKAGQSLYDCAFQPDDVLLFGRESAGVPPEVTGMCDVKLRIPIVSSARSLNLVQAASVALGEAMRQIGHL